MICNFSDLYSFKQTGIWQQYNSTTGIGVTDLDRLLKIYSMLDIGVYNVCLDLDDFTLLDELKTFAGRVESDRNLDNRMFEGKFDFSEVEGFLRSRIQYYDRYRDNHLISFQALMMASHFRAMLLSLKVLIKRRARGETEYI